MQFTDEIRAKLSAPFPEDELRVRIGSTNSDKTKGLAIAYIDARAVMDRLDDVVGPDNWEFTYKPLSQSDNTIAMDGTLTVLGIKRCDVGEAGREAEPYKACVSDTLKRCAVGFGIGRYLYRGLGNKWFPVKMVGSNAYFENETEVIKTLVGLSTGNAGAKAPATTTASITEAQVTLIKELRTKAYANDPDALGKWHALMQDKFKKQCNIDELTKAQASVLITALKDVVG